MAAELNIGILHMLYNKSITHTFSHARMDDGLFCFTQDHFLTRRHTLCPCVSGSPNELSPRESSLQQTHFWVRTHQPREQISGNYCIRLMILSSGKYFIPCWVSQTLRIISLCCAADKDPQASGMLLALSSKFLRF